MAGTTFNRAPDDRLVSVQDFVIDFLASFRQREAYPDPGAVKIRTNKEIFKQIDMIKEVTADDVMDAANKYFTEKNRTVAYRVQVEKEDTGEESADKGLDE